MSNLQIGTRNATVDAAKGVAILAVVCGHVLRGLHSAGLARAPGWAIFDALVYTFQMPLFFALSGFFLLKGIDRYGSSIFALRRIRDIGWPYLIWFYLQGLTGFLASAYTNRGDVGYRIFEIWVPQAQFWFVFSYLFWMCVAALIGALVRADNSRLWALAAVTIGAFLLVGWTADPTIVELTTRHGIFLVVGALAARFKVSLSVGTLAALLFGFFLAESWPPSWGFDASLTSLGPVFWVLFGALGSIAVLGLISTLSGATGRALEYLGRHCLEIYFSHIIFASGSRIVAEKLFLVHGDLFLFILGICSGIAGPLLLIEIVVNRLGQGWLFRSPKFCSIGYKDR